MDAGTIAAILTIGTIVVGAASALATHLLHRRAASGRVGTSEASVLWQQSQEMRSMLLAEKQKAEEQRDRLITSYTEQVFPMLSSINQLIQDLSVAVAEGVGMVRDISTVVSEGGGHAVPPERQAPSRR